jgi:hypothetical protein
LNAAGQIALGSLFIVAASKMNWRNLISRLNPYNSNLMVITVLVAIWLVEISRIRALSFF